jgi:hypothetical protein
MFANDSGRYRHQGWKVLLTLRVRMVQQLYINHFRHAEHEEYISLRRVPEYECRRRRRL